MPDLSIAQKTLRIMRVLHAALVLAALAYIILAILVARAPVSFVDPIVSVVFAVAALPPLGIAVFYRTRVVQPAAERLRANPDDNSAATRWRQGVLISLICCECVVLFGMVLRFAGGSWNVCAIFYAVGIFLMLAWTPWLELPPA